MDLERHLLDLVDAVPGDEIVSGARLLRVTLDDGLVLEIAASP